MTASLLGSTTSVPNKELPKEVGRLQRLPCWVEVLDLKLIYYRLMIRYIPYFKLIYSQVYIYYTWYMYI